MKTWFLHCSPQHSAIHTVYGKDVAEKFGVEEMEVTDEVFRSKYAFATSIKQKTVCTLSKLLWLTLGNLYIPKV